MNFSKLLSLKVSIESNDFNELVEQIKAKIKNQNIVDKLINPKQKKSSRTFSTCQMECQNE